MFIGNNLLQLFGVFEIVLLFHLVFKSLNLHYRTDLTYYKGTIRLSGIRPGLKFNNTYTEFMVHRKNNKSYKNEKESLHTYPLKKSYDKILSPTSKSIYM